MNEGGDCFPYTAAKKTAHNLMLFTGHYHIVAIAAIMVIASGYVISPDVNVMDVIADVMFTTILDAAYATHGVLSLIATSSITDGGSLELGNPQGIAIFESSGHTYAAVAAYSDDRVQIFNVTNPSNITAAGSIGNTDSLELGSPDGIATFESGGRTYAAVAAFVDDGVQILDVTNPSNITAAGSIGNTDSLELDGARAITIFESGGHTYAAVTANVDDGVQILDVTNPSNITAAGSIGNTDSLELDSPDGIAAFESGGHTYAAVAAFGDDGVQILNVTNPSNITAAGSIGNTDSLELDGPVGITIFESGGHTYAAVASYDDDGVQILNVTNPSNITAAGSIGNTDSLELDGAGGIATFESGGHTYAAVAAFGDDGVQILNVANQSNITAAGSITDNDSLELKGPWSIATFESGGHTYAAVTANVDDGVQIIRVDITRSDTTPPVIALEGLSTVTITVGVMYTDEGATCTDDVDGSITPTSSSDVNANQVGSYSVTYSCTDAAGNAATQVSRTVIVGSAPDTTPPVIALEGLSTVTITVGVMYTDEGATCTDDVDGSITPTSSSTVNVNQAGSYTVTYSCTDAAGNAATQVSRTVIVGSAPDTTPPVIALEGLSTVTITVGVMYTDEGATCTDGVDGSITPTSSSTVNVNQAGSYTVTYSCTDAAGNAATQVSRTVIVGSAPDTTPPVIALEGLSTVTITVGVMYTDEGATCTDGVDGPITPTSSSDVNANQAGSYTVTYSCTDAAGNAATQVSRTVIVGSAPDTTPPVIALEGLSTVTITVGVMYTDEGATCTDGVDGPITPTSSSDVNANQAGSYTVTYSCTDAAGNAATQVTRTVIVVVAADSVDPPTTRSGGGEGGSSKQAHALALDLGTVRSTGLASTPQEIVRYLGTFDPDEPIQPTGDAGRSDPPLAINGSAYLLGGTHNTLEPQALRPGEPTDITFTVYSTADIVHFAVNMSRQGADAGPPANYTLIRFSDGAVSTVDPGGLIADADVAITRVSGAAYKYRVQADIEFANVTGLTDMVITSENARGASTTVHVASAFEVLPPAAAQAEPDAPAPEPEPDMPEPDAPSYHGPPASPTAAFRMWAGFGPATVGDAGLAAALGLDYPGAEIPTWVKTGLAPMVVSGYATVDEFATALEYVLGSIQDRGARDTAGSRPADAGPDAAAPAVASIERSDPPGESTSETTLVFGVTFSEGVTGVDAGDFTLSPDSTGAGSVANLTGSGSRYLVTVSATRDGTYNLDVIRDSSIADMAGNPLSGTDPTGADHTYTVIADTTAPTVASIERSDPPGESTSETTLVFGVTFSEGVTGVDAGDFALSPDSGSGPGQFTHARTPGLAIPDNAAAISDAITVPGPGTATSVSVSVDIAHPFIGDLTVELVAPDGTARILHGRSGGNADGIGQTYAPDFGGAGIAGDWTLRASDGAPGDAGTLNGWTLTIAHDGAGGSVTGLTGSGSQYLVTVSATRNGTYNLDVVQDSGIADVAGNPLAGAAPTGADHTYTVVADTTAPTVASIVRSNPAGETTSAQTLVFAVTFGEDVTGVDADDFALSPDGGFGQFTRTRTPGLAIPDNAAAISDAITVPGPGTATSVSVSVDIAHPFIGDLTVELVAPDGTARILHDRSGGNADGIEQTYAPDFGGAGIAGDWTLRASDGAPGDAGTLNGWTLTIGHDGAGGSVTGLAGSGSQYLVTVSATRNGTYNLDVVQDSGIADVADNQLADAAPTGADHTYTVVADTTAPTVASIERSDPAGESTSETTLVFGVTFGEDVTGVDASDFVLSTDSGSGPGQFTRASTPGLAIPDNAAAISDAITVPGFGTATSVSVAVDIEHPFIGDLMVELVAPDGTAKTLHRYSGEGADDIIRTYTPDFGGTGIAGDWTLRASDRAPGDAGTLNGWTLTVTHDGAGGSVTGLAGSGSQYLVTVSAPQGGTYNLDVAQDSGIADMAGNPLSGTNPTGADHTYTRTGP